MTQCLTPTFVALLFVLESIAFLELCVSAGKCSLQPQTRFKGPKDVRLKSHPANRVAKKEKTHRKGVFSFLVAEMGFEPHDLRVMSPTSCQTAPLRDIIGAGSRGRTGTR